MPSERSSKEDPSPRPGSVGSESDQAADGVKHRSEQTGQVVVVVVMEVVVHGRDSFSLNS
jgi:hypothetical protein